MTAFLGRLVMLCVVGAIAVGVAASVASAASAARDWDILGSSGRGDMLGALLRRWHCGRNLGHFRLSAKHQGLRQSLPFTEIKR